MPTWIDPTQVRAPQDDIMTCKKCGCAWLELIEVHQYSKYHSVVLGQRPPSKMDMGGFYILRCIKCSELYEPNITIGPTESARKGYDAFLDQLEAPVPGEKK